MVNVIKATGEIEPFSEEKVLMSIRRAQVPLDMQDVVLKNIKNKLYDNIKTSEIYKTITDSLEHSNHPYSKAKYSLKRAIMDLGPTGYPFEDYVAEVLKSRGYITTVRTIVKGFCISHEIDIIAHKESPREEGTTIIEVKFHNSLGIRTDIHVALYTKARFDDIKKRHGFGDVWLVTNTKATSDAIAYANCVNMKIISWNYPEGESLRDLVTQSNLHPITVLTNLSEFQKQQLLNEHIILCKTICQKPDILDTLGISEAQKEKILHEAQFIWPFTK